MARTFGNGDNRKDKDGDENRKPRKKVPEIPVKEPCCHRDDDDDDTATPTHTPPSPSTSSSGSPVEITEEAVEAQHLYLDFVREEMSRNGLVQEFDCNDFGNLTHGVISEDSIDPARLMDWTRAGRELRQIADAFSQSRERQGVRKRAQNISFDELDFDNFFQLLQELFQGNGITRERILVLFFFCADVAIEALRRGFHRTFHNLIGWSLRYITTIVAQYVRSVGGWGVVLRHSLDIAYQVTACCAFLAVVAACAVYIRRNI